MAIIGSSQALKKLNSELQKIEHRTVQGLNAAAILIKNRSQTKTPVDEGNLRASHYINTRETMNGAVAEIGLTAEYATKVHEDMTARHTVGQAKYLESAINESRSEILEIVKRRAKV